MYQIFTPCTKESGEQNLQKNTRWLLSTPWYQWVPKLIKRGYNLLARNDEVVTGFEAVSQDCWTNSIGNFNKVEAASATHGSTFVYLENIFQMSQKKRTLSQRRAELLTIISHLDSKHVATVTFVIVSVFRCIDMAFEKIDFN